MKDHEIAHLVNELRGIATTYANAEQLRSLISECVNNALKQAAPAVERQEPAEWRYRFTHRGELSKWFPVDSYMKLYVIANDPAYEVQPLYAEQPAPVAVTDLARNLKAVIAMFAPGEDKTNRTLIAARAALDKVKELNQ